MIDVEVLAGSVSILVLGLALFIGGLSSLKEKRLIENTPTSKIRSLAMGPVEVYGEATSAREKLVKSPFTGTPCVWCCWTIEEYRKSKNSGYWATIKSGKIFDCFFLGDNTGTVLVDPDAAKVDVPADFQAGSGVFQKELPKQAISFMKNLGIAYNGLFGLRKNLRLTEYCIVPGDKLYVFGTAGDNPYVEEGSSQRNEADIMIQKGKDLYYISDKPEKEILSRHRWRILGGLTGGCALILAGITGIIAWVSSI